MSNRFYFGEDDNSSSDSDLDSLPYPKPLKRSDFLAPNFSATEYLSTLQNRHQTLEDLRTELRTRSQDLNKELLDLVNHNYQDFLGLGSSLKGGDEKVEEVRVGLLGFKREVEGLQAKVANRRAEMEELMGEKNVIREKIQMGRKLLELDRRIGELEQGLLLSPEPESKSKSKLTMTTANLAAAKVESNGTQQNGKEEDAELEPESDSDSEDEGEEEEAQTSLRKLRRRVEQYVLIKRLVERLGLEHPFVAKREDRIAQVRRTLLLDMGSGLKQAVLSTGGQGRDELFMLATYDMMGEPAEAITVAKEVKSQKS